MRQLVVPVSLATVLVLVLLSGPAEAIKKCFSCRSRGQLGDCRDPFYLAASNETVIASKSLGVETPPCSSGWCRKILEGVDKTGTDLQYGAATQRDCMVRPPSDNNERCAFVKFRGREVYMCFCKGDLCNGAPSGVSVSVSMVLAALLITREGGRADSSVDGWEMIIWIFKRF